MFSAWDFHSWLASVGAVLFMGILITGFAMLVTAVIRRILGTEPDVGESARMSRPTKEPPFRRAA